jgi:hypothetical protein
MAKKKVVVPSLKPHLTRSLKEARALRGKVAEPEDLAALITHLEGLEATAKSNCPTGSGWGRAFTLATTARKAVRKPSRKR